MGQLLALRAGGATKSAAMLGKGGPAPLGRVNCRAPEGMERNGLQGTLYTLLAKLYPWSGLLLNWKGSTPVVEVSSPSRVARRVRLLSYPASPLLCRYNCNNSH